MGSGIVQGSRNRTVVQMYRCSTGVHVTGVVQDERGTRIDVCRNSGAVKVFRCTGVLKGSRRTRVV